MSAILVISSDQDERDALVSTLRLADLKSVVTDSIFDAMSIIGRADLSAVVFPVNRRVLAAKGLCQIARREHPGIALLAVRTDEVSLERVQAAFPDPDVSVLDAEDSRGIIEQVVETLAARPAFNMNLLDLDTGNFDRTDPLDPSEIERAMSERAEPTETGPVAFRRPTGPWPDEDDDTVPHRLDAALTQPLLTGDLSATPGVELLVTLAIRNVTGVLEIIGDTSITFVAGDPVWATHRDGPEGWLRDLRRTGMAPAGTRIDARDEGALLDGLADREFIDARDVAELSRQLLQLSVARVLDAAGGAFTFNETAPPPRFVDEPMSIFEVLLTRARRSFDAREIRRRAKRFEGRPLFPTSALSPMAERLAPFLEGRDVSRFIDGRQPCRELWADLGLSREAGALLVLALVEANLATFDGDPVETTGRVILKPASGPNKKKTAEDSDSAPRRA